MYYYKNSDMLNNSTNVEAQSEAALNRSEAAVHLTNIKLRLRSSEYNFYICNNG